jgi:hypothetical protein
MWLRPALSQQPVYPVGYGATDIADMLLLVSPRKHDDQLERLAPIYTL